MGVIHFECLKEWVTSKRKVIETPSSTTYVWRNLHCELCQVKYQDVLRGYDNLRLIEITPPDSGQYVILESFQKHEDV